jgi:hypothetical protein
VFQRFNSVIKEWTSLSALPSEEREGKNPREKIENFSETLSLYLLAPK